MKPSSTNIALPCNGKKRGAVLVLVLGFALLLTWIALEILVSVKKELNVRASPAEESKLRQAAYQCLEISIGVLAEIERFEGALRSPAQGWAYPLSYAGLEESDDLFTRFAASDPEEVQENQAGEESADAVDFLDEFLADEQTGEDAYSTRAFHRVSPREVRTNGVGERMARLELPPGVKASVRLIDEAGKLSLTATSEDRWNYFFEEMGFNDNETRILRDSLLDWMDRDNEEREYGAETATYQQREPPYRAPNRPLRDFYELQLIRGFEDLFFHENGLPNENFAIFRQNVSLFHQDEVNLNTASEIIMRAIGEETGFDPDAMLNFLAGSDMEFGTEQDRVLQPEIPDEDLPRDREGNPVRGNTRIRYIVAEIAVSSGMSVFYLYALLDVSEPDPGGVYPYRLVRLAENQPL